MAFCPHLLKVSLLTEEYRRILAAGRDVYALPLAELALHAAADAASGSKALEVLRRLIGLADWTSQQLSVAVRLPCSTRSMVACLSCL